MFINFFEFHAIKNIHVIIKELKMLLSIAANRTKGKLKHGRNEEIWKVFSSPAVVQQNLIGK